ncbi:unnamed protein product [Cuscuta epithymum]|uniref:Uncharacterized protein n=1 Tax=Cuscuta epithymum TaxID=186058 RepID=A0AAV0F1L2_9ASTE|nr:unnamed protein product [Cuscuta epithymum]
MSDCTFAPIEVIYHLILFFISHVLNSPFSKK